MELLLLTGLFPKETESDIIYNSIGNVQNAANNLQWGFLQGFDEIVNGNVTVLNSLYIGSYPKRYRKIKIETYPFNEGLKNTNGLNVGFLNVAGFKIFSRYWTLKPYVKKWILSKEDKQKVVIAYAMTSTFTKLLEYAKKIDPTIITCLIVPDLPEYMNFSEKYMLGYKFMKKIEINIIRKSMQIIDSYVVLTRHIAEKINLGKPFTVVEGIAPIMPPLSDNESKTKTGLTTILYTGGIVEKYGVIDMINQFELLDDPNYRLIICGSGPDENTVIEKAKNNSRIIFKGLISRKEAIRLQQNSTVLINPRTNENEYAKYSFPSKIMEYMSSGRPVVAYMLDGMPNEYAKYMYVIDETKPYPIYETLKKVLVKSDEELDKFGMKAYLFVQNGKNSKRQCRAVLDMINRVKCAD